LDPLTVSGIIAAGPIVLGVTSRAWASSIGSTVRKPPWLVGDASDRFP
jgi:hypothetical protein